MFLATMLLAAFVGQAAPDGIDPRPIWLPIDTIVVAVTCEEWEPWKNPKDGGRVWRANFGAVIETDKGSRHLQSGDVYDGSAHDLWQQIEFQCGAEYGAGIGLFAHDAPLPTMDNGE